MFFLGKNPLQLFLRLQKVSNAVHGNFSSALSENHLNAGQCDARLEPHTVSDAQRKTLPDTSTPCGLHEKHTWNIPARLSASRFLSAPSYSHKFCVSCWRNRVVSGSLQLKADILRTSQAVCTSPLCPWGTKAILPHTAIGISAFAHSWISFADLLNV